MVSASNSKEIVRLAVDALNKRDRSAFERLHTSDTLVHGSQTPVRGIDAVTAMEFGLFDVFSDLTYELHTVIAEGDLVGARWSAVGTHDGEGLAGMAPTGKKVAFEVMGMFRIDGGRIAEAWVLPDRLDLMGQVGAVDLPLS